MELLIGKSKGEDLIHHSSEPSGVIRDTLNKGLRRRPRTSFLPREESANLIHNKNNHSFFHFRINRNRLRSRNPGIGRRDNFVASLHTEGTHRDVKCVRAIGAGNAVLHTQSFSPSFFKSLNIWTSDKGRSSDHFGNRGVDFRFDAQILSVQINKGNVHEIENIVWPFTCAFVPRSQRSGPRRL